jgi:hypothetical protein
MLLSWIVKTIPRSPRALFMLVIVLGSLAMLFSGLQNLFVPDDGVHTETVVRIVVGVALGLPATVIFYYFQAMDDHRRHDRRQQDLEIMNGYIDSQKRTFKRSRIRHDQESHY